jgi:hypothetical protein
MFGQLPALPGAGQLANYYLQLPTKISMYAPRESSADGNDETNVTIEATGAQMEAGF